jgi:hypothetical protein
MASHKGWDFLFPVLTVANSGGSFNLGKGQLGLIDLEGVPTATNGLKVINSVATLPKSRQLQLRIGKHDIANNRSQSSKDWSTETFRVSDILDLKVDAPKGGIGTDSFTLGYNGIDADTAIVLEEGTNEEISITLCGEVIGAIGYAEAEVEVKLYLDQPNVGPLKTMQEIVETAVEQFNNYKLMGDIPVTNYVKAVAVNSENLPLAGDEKYFYTLTIEDEGDSNALGLVQAQYDTKVVKTDRVGNESVYTIIADAPTSVTTGNFVVGQEYVITNVGDTDFTAIGAAANTIGEVFIATGAGGGTTGTADTVVVTAYNKNKAWKVKGCADCPSGYSQLTGGFVYVVTSDSSSIAGDLEGYFPNIVPGSAQETSLNSGIRTVILATTQEATDQEIASISDFLGEEYTIELLGEVSDICSSDNVVSTSWVQSAEPCFTSTETYTIVLEDDECGNDRLAEIQAAYPELSISVDSSGGCRTKYTTDVVTNLVCNECSDIYRDLFVSEAPADYMSKPWMKADPVYSETALMGIRFVAQPIKLFGTEVYRDDMPFFATSARLKIAGAAVQNINESFFEGTSGRFALTVDSIASEPENWGGNLWELEDITRRRQEGVGRHEGNNYAKWILGEETMLKPGVPYVDYILTIRKVSLSQSFSGEKMETFNYHFVVEPGKHVEVENLLNTLAGAAGVDPVQAYGETAP